MRLAVIFESSPFDRKGLFNAVHNRVKYLLATGECIIDVFCVHSRDNAFTRRVRHTPEVPSVDETVVDGIRYRLLWYRFSILDNVLLEKLHVRPWLFRRFMESHVDLLKGYDAVIAHSFCGGLFALAAHERFGVPYYVTWHGSDVHTHPWRVPVILEDTRAVMESARCNFFVSRALLDASERITSNARKEVLYNGVSEDFVKYSPEDRAAVRERYGLAPEDKVVAFVGNIVKVKNVLSLPEIFAQVAKGYDGPLKFWIIGDGKLRKPLEATMDLSFRPNEVSGEISFFGNQPSPAMPDIMNCIDVLVLPSLNEGLPLVCAEALSCGAAVVGSDVGGIAEVIGKDNVVPLVGPNDTDTFPGFPSGPLICTGQEMGNSGRPYDDSFVNGMTEKVVAALTGQSPFQTLPADISWARTAALELSILKSL